jgi:hypothetical protein
VNINNWSGFKIGIFLWIAVALIMGAAVFTPVSWGLWGFTAVLAVLTTLDYVFVGLFCID